MRIRERERKLKREEKRIGGNRRSHRTWTEHWKKIYNGNGDSRKRLQEVTETNEYRKKKKSQTGKHREDAKERARNGKANTNKLRRKEKKKYVACVIERQLQRRENEQRSK